MDRYGQMFERLGREDRLGFLPFVQLGDPDPATSLRVLHALVEAGADALELGIPFSDPIADGPTIQAASQRALQAGTTPAIALELVASLRATCPEIPIGLLVYANLVEQRGAAHFYAQAQRAGIDSVLIADVPLEEIEPYAQAARAHAIAPVCIAAPNTAPAQLAQLAEVSAGYTYVVTRPGVTGAGVEAELELGGLVGQLRELGAPPAVFGFGISRPEHLQRAREAGARAAIAGSAVVERLHGEGIEAMAAYVREMVAASRPGFG